MALQTSKLSAPLFLLPLTIALCSALCYLASLCSHCLYASSPDSGPNFWLYIGLSKIRLGFNCMLQIVPPSQTNKYKYSGLRIEQLSFSNQAVKLLLNWKCKNSKILTTDIE